ncbi:MAG: DUF2905 domain-containing protein [Bryobacter sp.]|jgi:ribose/xylose/arabinose/galactoside ABC-type transport system permease subunit|nr:DUF2905 domain-containing protein [Bryobacter sp. CoA8 C33]
MPQLGKTLIFAGLALAALGLLLVLADRLPIKPGQLPGDFTWRGKNTVVSFPLMTCLILSILGSLLLWLFQRR